VADGYQLWSDRYDREMEDIFAIQDDISQSIVKALRVILSEDEKKAIEKARTVNVEAYDYYIRGRQFFHQLRRKSLEHARQMFNRAIAVDPDYALAYSGVADCCSLLYMYFDANDANLSQADLASRKALELEPELAEAHVARGLAVSLSKRYDEAEHEYESAMRLDPKLFEAAYFFARARLAQGQPAEAAKLFERASALRPDDFQSVYFLAQASKARGMDADAKDYYRRSFQLIEERLELNPDDVRALILAGGALASLGEQNKALDFIGRALEADADDPGIFYNIACSYATLGKPEDALSALERAVEKGYARKDWMDNDPDLESIRDLPRYKALLQVM
jgi:tetratricopeptide (TPR) repeat protein